MRMDKVEAKKLKTDKFEDRGMRKDKMKNGKIRAAGIWIWITAAALLLSGCGGRQQAAGMEIKNGAPSSEKPVAVKRAYEIQLNQSPVFKDGSSRGDIAVINSGENSCAMQVTYYKANSEELLCQTEVLQPGERLTTAALQTPLEKGSYPVLAVVDLLEQDTLQKIGTVEADITFQILN